MLLCAVGGCNYRSSRVCAVQTMLPSLQFITSQNVTSAFEARIYSSPSFIMTSFDVGAKGALGKWCDVVVDGMLEFA